MKQLDPRTPVIIGVGFCQEKLDDPTTSKEAWQLMLSAVQNAAEDAGSLDVAKELETFTILKGMWDYKNPGKLIADALGCPNAKQTVADVGNLQLGALFDLCNAIAAGEQEIGVVMGGEAKFRELRSKITGQAITNTQQGDETPEPDVYMGAPDPFASDVEVNAGIFMPVELYAVIESALRHHKGLSVEAHRDYIANLYSSFSEVAVKNPLAWNREAMSAEELRNATDKNAMLAFPYTKKFNSQWNVNQASAVIVCSLEKAKALMKKGLALNEARWIYPIAAAQSRHVVCLAQQKQLHSQPASVMAGEQVYAMAGITAKDVQVADLYSCFPSAIQSYGHDLKLDDIPWTVSGCMAFAGGPYNHSSLDSAVRMVDVLRERAEKNKGKQIGLVSNLSGIYGKHAVCLFSNQPNEAAIDGMGYGFKDITEEVAKINPPLPTNPEYAGPAKIVGYTVAYIKNNPSHAFVYCENTKGERTVAKTMDQTLLAKMTSEEFVGKIIEVQADLTFLMAG